LSAGALRAFFIFFIICAFNLSTINLYAQDESVSDEDIPDGYSQDETATIVESPVADPITAEEWDRFWDGNTTRTAQPVPVASALSILRVLLTLVLAAAAIYGLVYLIKRFSRGNTTKDPFLKVIASVPLATNRNAHIISAGSRAWLVGASENGVNLIAEIEDKDLLNAMLLEDSRKSATASMDAGRFPDFRALLHKLGMTVGAKAPGTEEIRKRSEKLKGL
jgi:flagellar protein FliO/FliZ